GGLAVTAIVARDDALAFATQPANLMIIAVALMGVGLAWVVVIGASHLALRPAYPSPGRRIAGAVVVGVLSLAVITPVAFGADLSYTLSTTVSTIFAETPTQDESSTVPQLPEVDPWANKPRLNVLILGGDYDPNYSGNNGSRTDSVILASIDTKTGSTTLFSLPRQTARMPFPSDSPLHRYFPYGWYDGRNGTNPNYFLNAMFHLLPYQVPKNVLGKTPYLGEDALKLSVGEALGLKVDYFVYVSMDGLRTSSMPLAGSRSTSTTRCRSMVRRPETFLRLAGSTRARISISTATTPCGTRAAGTASTTTAAWNASGA
ncbi:MAG: hypothetical protein FWF28_05650, partial [Micrococcales bacterium]|nr:hypothetical protein [Micrococcales bacterium]